MPNLIILLIFTVSSVVDMALDLNEGIPLSHIWHEVILFLIALAGLIWQIRLISNRNTRIRHLSQDLLKANEVYKTWQSKTQSNAQELRRMIDQQFDAWHLSPSERDVAILLIKGFAMKEIADLRQTHEKTVRQQATQIYRKSCLAGRQELSAFFLEDILSAPVSTS